MQKKKSSDVARILQFNTSDTLTRAAILERTNLSNQDLHHLDSLVKVCSRLVRKRLPCNFSRDWLWFA